MIVVKVTDQDVAEKVDTDYIREQLADLENIGIIYICTPEGGEESEWMDEEGVRHIVIHLPYKEVRRTNDIRALMLARAKERLGLAA